MPQRQEPKSAHKEALKDGGRTVSISVVCRHLLTNGYRPDDAKRDVPPFAKELAIVIAIMLYRRSDVTRGAICAVS